jgi:hypothetical protein
MLHGCTSNTRKLPPTPGGQQKLLHLAPSSEGREGGCEVFRGFALKANPAGIYRQTRLPWQRAGAKSQQSSGNSELPTGADPGGAVKKAGEGPISFFNAVCLVLFLEGAMFK